MKSVQLGELRIWIYGLCLAVGAGAALLLMHRKTRGIFREGTVPLFALMAVPLGFFGGRLAQALVSQGGYLFRQNFFFNFTRGGYLLYGSLAGIALAAWAAARIMEEKTPVLLDAIAAPGLLLIAVCRFSEGLIGCGYGRAIEEWFDPMLEQNMVSLEDPAPLLRFPFGIPNYYGEWCWSVFLLEGIAALIFFGLLLRKRGTAPGGVFLLALLLYAGAQTVLESLRADSIPRWGFVRVNQLLSGVAVFLVLLLSTVRMWGKGCPFPWKGWAGLFLCIGLIIAMEFAVEGKIAFLQWMKMDVCYGVMGLGSLGLILSVLPAWKAAWQADGETGED